MNILVIFTCYNRKGKTENCIRKLTAGNLGYTFTFVAVDDNSKDGTRDMLHELQGEYDIHLVEGDGNLFYSGGMRTGMEYALGNLECDYDYLFMCNDDVEFYERCIEKMVRQSVEQQDAVIVGAMQNSFGEQSYGVVKYTKGIKYRKLAVGEWREEADTFNANGVLIPYEVFRKIGAMDRHYIHGLGDFDYGLAIKRSGYKIHSSKEYIGKCENNPVTGTWNDNKLSRRERISKKESVKGAPAKKWFYFLKKNFGIVIAIKGCITPYIRIIMGR